MTIDEKEKSVLYGILEDLIQDDTFYRYYPEEDRAIIESLFERLEADRRLEVK